eukprot:2213513-Rhodomonas_salina.2
MSGTDIAYGAMLTMSGRYGHRPSAWCWKQHTRPTRLPGTDTAHGAIGLRACYALSGTELAYAAMRHSERKAPKHMAHYSLHQRGSGAWAALLPRSKRGAGGAGAGEGGRAAAEEREEGGGRRSKVDKDKMSQTKVLFWPAARGHVRGLLGHVRAQEVTCCAGEVTCVADGGHVRGGQASIKSRTTFMTGALRDAGSAL